MSTHDEIDLATTIADGADTPIDQTKIDGPPGGIVEAPNIIGDCVVQLHDADTDRKRIVVTKADPNVMATIELVDELLSGNHHPDVTVDRSGDRPVVRFGTDGEGLGRVAYEIDDSGIKNGWLVTGVHLRRVE